MLQCPGWGRDYNLNINSNLTNENNNHKNSHVYAFWLMMWWILAGQVLSIQHACTATATLSAKGTHCWGSCLPMISTLVYACSMGNALPLHASSIGKALPWHARSMGNALPVHASSMGNAVPVDASSLGNAHHVHLSSMGNALSLHALHLQTYQHDCLSWSKGKRHNVPLWMLCRWRSLSQWESSLPTVDWPSIICHL